MKKNSKRIIVGILSLAVFALLWNIFLRSREPTPEVLTITPTEFISEVSVAGSVRPSKSAELAFGQTGIITRVNVSTGDFVKAGSILASLQNEDLEADLLQRIYIWEAERADLGIVLEGGTLEENRVSESESSNFSIGGQQAEMNAAEADILSAHATLKKTLIIAPFDGIIGRVDADVGETAFPETTLFSLQSTGPFEIESFIPELDIPDVKVGNQALVTLDAYGPNVSFPARVISIDSSETILNNAPTYKVKLVLLKTDERIKSGMTANTVITTEYLPNKILVPEGTIYEKNGNKYVQVKSEDKIIEQQIVTGKTSSLGQVEVVSGLNPGDQLVLNPNQ